MKALARALTPPMLWRGASRIWQLVAPAPARRFSGVFASFGDVSDERPWAQPAYLAASRRLLEEARAGQLPPKSATAHALLAFLINTLPAGKTPAILDWAGGTGIRYWALRRALTRPVQWHVVDSAVLAALSADVMGTSGELTFAEQMPAAPSVFDVVIVYSALQYVDAQGELLAALAGYRPRYLVMPRLMVTSGGSFVTRQDIYGRGTPCRVSSLADVIGAMRTSGYEPVLDIADGLDLSSDFAADVPPARRAGRERLLVFRVVV